MGKEQVNQVACEQEKTCSTRKWTKLGYVI